MAPRASTAKRHNHKKIKLKGFMEGEFDMGVGERLLSALVCWIGL